jgi:hypothetical protein
MSSATSTTQPEAANVNAQREASVIAGVTKPATPARKRPSAATRKSAQTAKSATRKSAAKPASKPTPKPAGKSETTASARKIATINVMIDLCANAVASEAQWNKFRTGVPLAEARAIFAARLSYAPGDYWRPELDAPTVLQAGKRSKIARTAAAQRVTRPSAKTATKPTPKSMSAKRIRKPAA